MFSSRRDSQLENGSSISFLLAIPRRIFRTDRFYGVGTNAPYDCKLSFELLFSRTGDITSPETHQTVVIRHMSATPDLHGYTFVGCASDMDIQIRCFEKGLPED